jgi:hypothetical protein
MRVATSRLLVLLIALFTAGSLHAAGWPRAFELYEEAVLRNPTALVPTNELYRMLIGSGPLSRNNSDGKGGSRLARLAGQ